MQSPNLQARDFSPLVFDGVLAIVGGGVVDETFLRSLHADGTHIIAADGGAEVCAQAGVMPEAIVGDMDSLKDPGSWAEKTLLIKLDEQETTDFEKCLYSTRAPLTLALGMTGKRFDHTLCALDAVARYAGDRRIILVDEQDIALAITGAFTFEVSPGERVSIHPLREITFQVSKGLRYALDGVTLAPGRRTGTSNAAVKGIFSIVPGAVEMSPWLLILSRHNLQRLIALFV